MNGMQEEEHDICGCSITHGTVDGEVATVRVPHAHGLVEGFVG